MDQHLTGAVTPLPESFRERMRKMLGKDYPAFEESYRRPHFTGVRVNNLKLSGESFEKISPFEISRIKWIPNGYYYNGDDLPAKHPYYYAGLYYIQEPSAMTPASLLPVSPGDKVLDLCAAPGGKTTELGAGLGGSGVLITNDISNSRAKALLKNVELAGIRNAVVISESPEKLAERFEGYFDSILVDAPCSGEGMFRKSHAIIKNWEQYGSSYYAGLQRQILPQAVKMLKPGGYMVYSTCTFSPLENEESLSFILNNYPEMHVVPFSFNEGCDYDGIESAVPEFLEKYDAGRPDGSGNEERYAEIRNAIRIYPHKLDGEGHFVALLRKDGIEKSETYDPDKEIIEPVTNDTDRKKNVYRDERKKYRQISDEAFDFLERLGMRVPAGSLWVKGEGLYMLPEGLPDMSGLRILRSGLFLGEMKKGRFEPSQALAMALRGDEYPVRADLDPSGSDVIRYLKCESIEVPQDTPDGYVLVCTGGYPLGWGKVTNGRFKNRYLPGWRMM